MNLVKKRLSDKKYTKIGGLLSDAKMAEFLAAVRILVRDRLFVCPSRPTVIGASANLGIIRNGTSDTWPVRDIHGNRPDICYSILRAVEENWHLFKTNDQPDDLEIDGAAWEDDETVLCELIFAPFYEL